MTYSHADYYQECFEVAFDEQGLWHLVEQMTAEQRAAVGKALADAVATSSMAFHVPENPLIAEKSLLERKLKYERELQHCTPCAGSGRLQYHAGPWAVNTDCHHCNGAGKVHPFGKAVPA